jgi:integrase
MEREGSGLLHFASLRTWEEELHRRLTQKELEGQSLSREHRLRLARQLWREQGCVEEDRVRTEFMRVTKAIGLQGYTAPKMLRHLFATTLQEGRVDPLIRNELMGHVRSGDRSASHGLAMTAVYTHTRPETRRAQLEQAIQERPALEVAQRWLEKHVGGNS